MELNTRYDPKAEEARLYAAWDEAGCFQPAPDATGAGRTFTVMIPPPNVTGVLHMGHALNNTIQDIVIRHRRMRGFETLWVPGTDHAGIATQAVVEKKLYAEGKTRQGIGREAFLEEVWSWKEEHGNTILGQLRGLGCSCDWTRTRFTLEPMMSRAVRESFVRLFDKGYVYRGSRLVNWDCKLQTAVSDDEIEHERRKSKLYYLRYPVEGEPDRHLTVATTRPETMLGDTGVAVHPDDARFKDLVGRSVLLPFVERAVPIVADDTVDPEYGTGAVKVTPGHDPADYERGKRHGLPIVNVLTKDGKINENGARFEGMPREVARKEIVDAFEQLGLLEKVEDIQNNVTISDRSKTPIEPMVSEQWFVAMKELAGPAIAAARDGTLRFVPERWSKVYLDWLENVHDWCISRQLWWGHRIPVWYDEDGVPVASREDLAVGAPHPKTGKPITHQDPDVLDTWASSWLWPFATLGWPDRTLDLERYYPTQFLSTARDIIYLWVARMIIAGYELVDHLPKEERCAFTVCNIHANVLDAKGKRMSKSAGNGVDPLEMIDKYGADAVRFSLILLTREGQDVKLSPDKFEQGYRFGNKVWNAARFALMHLRPGTPELVEFDRADLAVEDRWILSRLARAIREVDGALDDYRLNDAATAAYRFVWNEFCDWYLEIVKPRLLAEDGDRAASSAPAARATLTRVLADVLGLLHPFTPFMTEVLWKALGEASGRPVEGFLMTSPYPDGAGLTVDETAERELTLVQEFIGAVRTTRMITGIGERKKISAIASVPSAEERAVLARHERTLHALGYFDELALRERTSRPAGSVVAVNGAIEVFLPLEEGTDVAALRDLLVKKAEKLEAALNQSRSKLANEGFMANADPELVEKERELVGEREIELAALRRNVDGL